MKRPENITQDQALHVAIHLIGYTNPEIAEAIGVSDVAVRNFVNGHSAPSDDAVRKIAKFLGILPERLLAYPRRPEHRRGLNRPGNPDIESARRKANEARRRANG